MADVKKLKINGTNYDIKIPSENVKLMTGYSKGSSTNAITPSDSLNSAIGKLECRADANQANLTLLKNLNGRINYSSVTGFTESRTTSGFTIYYAFSETIPAGEYRIICDAALTDTSKSDQFRLLYSLPATSDTINITPIVSNGHFVSNKITLDKPVVALDLYVNTPTTISNFMIIDEATYQAGFRDYMSHSLPNTTITPALIDQVDAGAKNIVKLVNPYGPGIDNNPNLSVTVNKSTGIVTISGTTRASGLIYLSDEMSNIKGYVLSGKQQVTEDYYHQVYTVVGASGIGNDRGNGAVISDNAICRDCVYVFTDKTINATLKPMICTQADWKVSQKYVPHAKSNYDLTQYTDGLRLTNLNTLSSGSLDDLKDTQFRLIDLNVTGKPYGVTSRGFLRVSRFDGNASLQEFFVLTEGSDQHATKPYVRMSNGNVWSDWYATSVRSKTYTFNLPNTTFTKAATGVYYAKQEISGFNHVLSVSLKDCGQLPNALILPYLETSPSLAVGLYTADPTSPSTITFPTGIVTVNVVGF